MTFTSVNNCHLHKFDPTCCLIAFYISRDHSFKTFLTHAIHIAWLAACILHFFFLSFLEWPWSLQKLGVPGFHGLCTSQRETWFMNANLKLALKFKAELQVWSLLHTYCGPACKKCQYAFLLPEGPLGTLTITGVVGATTAMADVVLVLCREASRLHTDQRESTCLALPPFT